jgi:23S rRNA pseudouridine2605 synthase
MAQERLQKILARAGIASRRAAEQLITSGRVRVNGAVVNELGARADTDSDRIDVDGKPIAREEHVYYLIHKPRGMVTTLKDPEDRPSLSELLHDIPERVYPVGRLDFHTSGALLLTNDGDLAQALLHPSRAVPKTYVVKVSVEVDEAMLSALERGVVLDDGYRTQQAFVEHIRDEDGKSWIQITITEGKNRQIHRMIEALNARVMRLSRISFAGLKTEDLRPGEIRPLYQEEVAALKRDYMSDGPREKPSRDTDEDASDEAGLPARRPALDKKTRDSDGEPGPGRAYADRGGAPRGPAERDRPTRQGAGRAATNGARAARASVRSEEPSEAAPVRRPVSDRLPRAYLESGRDRPARSTTSRDRPAAGKPAREASGRDRPVREASGRDRPVREASGRDRPMREASGRDRSVREARAGDKPARATAARDRPARAPSGRDQPVREAAGHDKPVRDTGGRDKPRAAKHGDPRYAATDKRRTDVDNAKSEASKVQSPKPRAKGDTRPRVNAPTSGAAARKAPKRA